MGWRIRVEHRTGYSYAAPVSESYTEVRLIPRDDDRQNVLAGCIETTPPTRPYRYADYWGTTVAAFDLHTPHTELVVTATAEVETADASTPVRSATWQQLAGEPVRDRFSEMLEFTSCVGRDRGLARTARSLRRGRDPADAVLAACRWVRRQLTYRAGTTGVHTSAVQAWEARTGVCQDFSHLTLLLVREMGIPARYVSGCLLPAADAAVGQTVRGVSHAWIEAWTGGWWGYDPTNDIGSGPRHVRVALGRDHADVPLLKGVYSGGTAAVLDVAVDMTRLA